MGCRLISISFFAKVLLQGENFDQAVEMFNAQQHDVADVINRRNAKVQKFRNSVVKRYKRLTGARNIEANPPY